MENKSNSLWKEVFQGLWVIPGLLGLGILSFIFVFPLWWLAQSNGTLFTWLALGLLAAGAGGLFFMKVRRAWVLTPPGRRASEVLWPALGTLGWILAYGALGVFFLVALMAGSLVMLGLGLGIFFGFMVLKAWLNSRKKRQPRALAPRAEESPESLEP